MYVCLLLFCSFVRSFVCSFVRMYVPTIGSFVRMYVPPTSLFVRSYVRPPPSLFVCLLVCMPPHSKFVCVFHLKIPSFVNYFVHLF